jgi:hypothetical protein
MIGHSESLKRRSQGPSAAATHLSTATDLRGGLTAGGILLVNTLGRDAMEKLNAANPVDVALATAILLDETNPSMLARRKEYYERHQQQVRKRSYDDGWVLLVAHLLPHCERLRQWRAAGRGQWYVVPSFTNNNGATNFTADRMGVRSRMSYRCTTVPASMLSRIHGSSLSSAGFSAEQVEEWISKGAVHSPLGGGSAQDAKSGRLKECTNSWCTRMITADNLQRHVRDCAKRHAAGKELAAPRNSLSKRANQGARGFY